VLRRLVGEEERQLVDEPAEVLGSGLAIAQQPELVAHQRVRDLRDHSYATYVVYPRKPGYSGRRSVSAAARRRSAPMSGWSASAATISRPTSRKSSSSKPRIV